MYEATLALNYHIDRDIGHSIDQIAIAKSKLLSALIKPQQKSSEQRRDLFVSAKVGKHIISQPKPLHVLGNCGPIFLVRAPVRHPSDSIAGSAARSFRCSFLDRRCPCYDSRSEEHCSVGSMSSHV